MHFNFNRLRIQNCSIGQGKRSNMKQANLRRPPSSSFACSLTVISNKERQSRLPLRTATLQFTPDPCHSSSFALLYSLTLSFSRAIKSGGNTTAQQDLKKKKRKQALMCTCLLCPPLLLRLRPFRGRRPSGKVQLRCVRARPHLRLRVGRRPRGRRDANAAASPRTRCGCHRGRDGHPLLLLLLW